MKIEVEKTQAAVPITVMSLDGELDASNYLDVIGMAQKLYREDTHNLLLDLGRLSFMASSGLVALYSIALLLRGEQQPDTEQGWSVLHAATDFVEKSRGPEPHFKLLNPQPKVDRTLEMTGFKSVFAVFTDRSEALASFS